MPETLAQLADHPNIVGMKEATGNLEQMTQDIILCGEKLSFLSGDDTLTLPLMSVGGKGIISVVANIVPKDVADLTHAFLNGDWKRARELHLKLFPLCQAMFPSRQSMVVFAMDSMSEAGLFRLLTQSRKFCQWVGEAISSLGGSTTSAAPSG